MLFGVVCTCSRGRLVREFVVEMGFAVFGVLSRVFLGFVGV